MLIRFLIAGVVTVTLTTSGNNSAMLTNYVFDDLVPDNPDYLIRSDNSQTVQTTAPCMHRTS